MTWKNRDDAMVKTLLRNREDLYDDYNPEQLRQYLETELVVKRHEVLGSGTRELYYAQPKA